MTDPRSFLPLTPMAFQVLLALVDADRHGYGIIREVDQRTAGRVRLRTGSLYTLLQRLLEALHTAALIQSPVIEERGAHGSVPTAATRARTKYLLVLPRCEQS